MTNQLEIQKNIQKHLFNTQEEFSGHLSGEKVRFLLTLAWQTPTRKKKAEEILDLIDKILLGDEVDEKTQLENYKNLYNNWNENEPIYDGSLDFGGNLLALKELLDQWENPPQPALTTEQEKKIKDYDEFFEKRPQIKDLKKLGTSYDSLEKENERLRNRQLNENEQKIIALFVREIPNSGELSFRLRIVKGMLASLENNDLTVQANPNLSIQRISLPERLAASFRQIVWIYESYLRMEKELQQEIKELEDQLGG